MPIKACTYSALMMHLQCLDDADIFRRHSCMIRQINSVLCNFRKLPSSVKLKLIYAFCSSFNGCALWDLWNKNIDTVLYCLEESFEKGLEFAL